MGLVAVTRNQDLYAAAFINHKFKLILEILGNLRKNRPTSTTTDDRQLDSTRLKLNTQVTGRN